jgi:hypothetical protein
MKRSRGLQLGKYCAVDRFLRIAGCFRLGETVPQCQSSAFLVTRIGASSSLFPFVAVWSAYHRIADLIVNIPASPGRALADTGRRFT